MRKAGYIITGIVLAALIITNFIMLDRIGYLENRLSNDINGLNQQLRSMHTRLDSFVHEVSNSYKLVAEQSYDIEQIVGSYESAEVKYDLRFNKLPKQAKVYLLYEDYEQNEGKWIRAELQPNKTDNSGLEYYADLELSYDGNYNLRAVVESPEETVNENLHRINLKQQLTGRFNFDLSPRSFSSNGNATYDVIVSNYYRDEEALKLDSLMCYVYFDDELIEEVDILQEAEIDNWPEDVERWHYAGSVKVDIPEGKNTPEPFGLFELKVVAKDRLGKEYIQTYQRP